MNAQSKAQNIEVGVAVIATGGPSLLGLTGYPVGRSPGTRAVGPWAICYTYHGIGAAG
jgi:hypothetical protein